MIKSGSSIIISGVGSYLPERRLGNDELSQMVDTTDEWIVGRTGIRERRIGALNESTSVLAMNAAEAAIRDAGVKKEEIDMVIVGTLSPDMPFPATACGVQYRLGLGHVPAFDIQAACSGFVYALEVGHKMMRGGGYRNILVIGAEKMSSILDWTDRATCVLFGDGAGAVILSRIEEGGYGVIDSLLAADGSQSELLYVKAGGSLHPTSQATLDNKEHFLRMTGREVFKYAVRLMEQSIQAILERNGLVPGDIDLVIPHQANMRIIEALTNRLNFPIEKCIVNLDSYGNTSAASIPIALAEAYEGGRIKRGDNILLVAFGAGLTWGATLIRWY